MQLSEAISLINHPQLYHTHQSNWADLGCGPGLFTHALSTFLAEESSIYAMDKVSLHSLPDHHHKVHIYKAQLDFVKDTWPVSSLDGIFMANSLHYVRDQPAFIKKAQGVLTNNGKFLVVEYDTDRANQWVPYPLSFTSLKKLFTNAGYTSVEKINERPSAYNSSKMYAAIITL